MNSVLYPHYPWHTKKPEVVREWVTPSGQHAVIKLTPLGHYCGYVELPSYARGLDYTDIDWDVTVHGGLTYGDGTYIGFDCAHMDDGVHPEYDGPLLEFRKSGVFRDRKYVTKECENLAAQLWHWKFVLRCCWAQFKTFVKDMP